MPRLRELRFPPHVKRIQIISFREYALEHSRALGLEGKVVDGKMVSFNKEVCDSCGNRVYADTVDEYIDLDDPDQNF